MLTGLHSAPDRAMGYCDPDAPASKFPVDMVIRKRVTIG
jgi:hypothetical protein